MVHRRLMAGAIAAAITLVGATVVEAGPSGGALPPELIKVVHVAGNYGIPDDAEMVAFNLTAVDAAATGRLTAYPCDAPTVPRVSNLNYLQGDIVPNFSLTRIADDGTICIYTHAITDVLVDIVGYVPTGSAITPLPEPHRIHNTRDTGQPAAAGTTIEVDITAHPDIPDSADVVMFNLTAANATGPGHARVHACDTDKPATSALNYTPGRAVANFVTSRIAPDGTICIWTRTTTHLMIDVVAYATDGIVPLAEPIRIRNTRDEPTTPQAGDTLTIDLGDHLPDNANAALYNLTAADPQRRGYATSHPCDQPRPTASNLNYTPNRNAAAGTITKLAPDQTICIYTKSPTHYIVDLTAYATTNTHYTPLPNPVRAINTRDGWQADCDWVMRSNTGAASLLNIRTGQERIIPPPGPDDGPQGAGPVIARDCESLWWLIADESSERTDRPLGLYRLSLTGVVMSFEPLPSALEHSPTGGASIHELADGTIVYVDGYIRHYDARSGDLLWAGPRGGTPTFGEFRRATLGPDSLAVYVYEHTGPEPGGAIELWDWRTRTLLDAGDVILVPHWTSITPDGTYMAMVLRFEDDPSTYGVVHTRFGDPVTFVYAENFSYRLTFVGPGDVLICAPDVGYFRWQLFNTPVYQEHLPVEADCGVLT